MEDHDDKCRYWLVKGYEHAESAQARKGSNQRMSPYYPLGPVWGRSYISRIGLNVTRIGVEGYYIGLKG